MAKLIQCAIQDKNSPFHSMPGENIVAEAGRLRTRDQKIDVSFEDVMRSASVDSVDGQSFVHPGEELKKR